MKLYQLPYSHFSAKVRIVALEKSLKLELPAIPGEGQNDPQYLAINPTGLVPCLMDGDFVLSESEVIAEYLNDQVEKPAMLPDSARLRAESRWLSRMHDLYVAPQLATIYGLTLANELDVEAGEAAVNVLFEYLDMVEAKIDPSPFFFGDRFCISDASFCLSFWYALGLSAQFGKPLASSRFPKLSTWFGQIADRPSFNTVLNDCKQSLGLSDEAKTG